MAKTRPLKEVKCTPCICGSRSQTLYQMVNGNFVFECNKCGYTPFSGRSVTLATREWNHDMVDIRRRLERGYSVPYVFNKKGAGTW